MTKAEIYQRIRDILTDEVTSFPPLAAREIVSLMDELGREKDTEIIALTLVAVREICWMKEADKKQGQADNIRTGATTLRSLMCWEV